MTRKDEPFIRIKSLSKSFVDENNPEATVHAVRDFDLDIAEGEFVCVVGPSGCGKTTLLRCIAGLTDLSTGKLLVHGRPVAGRPPDGVAMVLQHFGLLP